MGRTSEGNSTATTCSNSSSKSSTASSSSDFSVTAQETVTSLWSSITQIFTHARNDTLTITSNSTNISTDLQQFEKNAFLIPISGTKAPWFAEIFCKTEMGESSSIDSNMHRMTTSWYTGEALTSMPPRRTRALFRSSLNKCQSKTSRAAASIVSSLALSAGLGCLSVGLTITHYKVCRALSHFYREWRHESAAHGGGSTFFLSLLRSLPSFFAPNSRL